MLPFEIFILTFEQDHIQTDIFSGFGSVRQNLVIQQVFPDFKTNFGGVNRIISWYIPLGLAMLGNFLYNFGQVPYVFLLYNLYKIYLNMGKNDDNLYKLYIKFAMNVVNIYKLYLNSAKNDVNLDNILEFAHVGHKNTNFFYLNAEKGHLFLTKRRETLSFFI